MKKLASLLLFWTFSTLICAQQIAITTPQSYFGFTPGDDRELFNYEKLIGYLTELDSQSPKLKMLNIGTSPMGKPIYIAFISSAENLNNLDRLKEINHQLALNVDLSEADREKYSEEGRVFVYATLSMHSGEVGPAQSSALVAYNFATDKNPETAEMLNNVVYMMVPAHNPDGMNMVVENYLKYKGTKYEGASLPRVYHKYIGHDNNRDFVILSQEDTRAIARVYNQTWLPQVMVEKHQMGRSSARYFVPPMHDPIAVNVDAGLWTWAGVFGQNLINDMTNEGLAGVSQNYIFDNYWPGSTETCLWNNVIAFLTECASAKDASPIYIEPNELMAYGKGISEYKKGSNFPLPWEGGWWRLSDIVNYELSSTKSIIKTASIYKKEILLFRNDMCKREVSKGLTKPPYYYVIPQKQHDQSELINMINLIRRHGINVYTINKDVLVDGRIFNAGDYLIPLAQPYRALIKEILEEQEYPERHYSPGGKLMKPYDITSWSLPLHRQVRSFEIDQRVADFDSDLSLLENDIDQFVELPHEFAAGIFSIDNNESFKAAFMAMSNELEVKRLNADTLINNVLFKKESFVVYGASKSFDVWNKLATELIYPPMFLNYAEKLDVSTIKVPRIALIETYFHDMDAGWTRFIFDEYYIPYTVLHPEDLKTVKLKDDFDVLLFPDVNVSQLMEGMYKSDAGGYSMSSYAPEYVVGMGKEGKVKVLEFIDNGGVVLSWGRSTGLFEGMLKIGSEDEPEKFQLPYKDISKSLAKEGLYVAGSLLQIKVNQDSPLTYGMPMSIGVFSRGKPVFATSLPKFDMDRRVIATFTDHDLLMSGYIAKPKLLYDKSAMIWLKKGKGQLVLYGFNPQFRASTQASFKLLFNGLFLGAE